MSWSITLLLAATAPSSANDLGSGKPGGDPLAALTGRDIYQRVLDNSFDSLIQESTLVSGDRGGNAQESRFKMWFQDLRDAEAEQPTGTTIARTLVQYTHPFDIRYSGYLILSRLDAVNDQFVYLSSQRRVKRVNLRGEAVFGTDFSFEDILPRHIEDADYTRLGDESANDSDCFVIEAVPKDHSLSEYSRLRIYIDKQRNVPLVTRYWDDRMVEVKELRAEPKQIENIEGVWVPKLLTMRHLKLDSYTTLELQQLDPNPPLTKTTFELRRLESH
ncbi:MAG: outer membrane lipoprotein-sorting protein [Myxococcota bacterium]|nr:outer membrane lipoprotein-sorting protein [Myxococcota bacterium]